MEGLLGYENNVLKCFLSYFAGQDCGLGLVDDGSSRVKDPTLRGVGYHAVPLYVHEVALLSTALSPTRPWMTSPHAHMAPAAWTTGLCLVKRQPG